VEGIFSAKTHLSLELAERFGQFDASAIGVESTDYLMKGQEYQGKNKQTFYKPAPAK